MEVLTVKQPGIKGGTTDLWSQFITIYYGPRDNVINRSEGLVDSNRAVRSLMYL